MARPEPRPKTADRLRADIDKGLTGEKVPGSDPAAAPLGTDAEAGGAPPTRREVDLEARSRMPQATEADLRPGRDRGRIWAACLLVLLVLGLVAAMAFGGGGR